ncbi:probable transcriptional regulatory protein At2g25830 [Solanum stenotomum]|uniref:probable transcriptional regulatory protein At2g25830 n=1 Tax=Solanum stenotomum TaxID=172797 RepID=UPI0020D1162E|nr:probable transcriptional regulatory protein At2g25830 [Solanum stenotomum]
MVYSSSSIRAFGSLLCRISNGVNLKPHHSCTLRSVFLLSGNFSSSSWYSSSDIKVLPLELQSSNSVRKIWTSSPLCMGRRSCKIAGRKV